MLSVCLYIPPINFWTHEPIFMKLGMYIMAPESISAAYFITRSHQPLCLCIPVSSLGNSPVKTLPRQRIQATESELGCTPWNMIIKQFHPSSFLTTYLPRFHLKKLSSKEKFSYLTIPAKALKDKTRSVTLRFSGIPPTGRRSDQVMHRLPPPVSQSETLLASSFRFTLPACEHRNSASDAVWCGLQGKERTHDYPRYRVSQRRNFNTIYLLVPSQGVEVCMANTSVKVMLGTDIIIQSSSWSSTWTFTHKKCISIH
jgi:hypothetical protein